MYGLKRSMKKPELANGGRVRGPGTGTSDDIDTEVPRGSYIMPADSTAQVIDGKPQGFGLKPMPARKQPGFGLHAEMAPKPQPSGQGFGLRRPGESVPVSLSNGEHSLSPDQVQEVGARVLDAVRDVTHVPAAEQAGGDQRLQFSNGGKVGGLRRLPPQEPPRLGLHRRMLADGGRVDGYTNSPEREAWLRDIAARGNKSPTAQITAAQPKPGGLRRPDPREQPRLGIGPNSAGSRKLREIGRQGYADGGIVDDEERRPSLFENTASTLRDTSRDVANFQSQGRPLAATGRSVRGAAETPFALARDSFAAAGRAADTVIKPVAEGVREFGAGLAGSPEPRPVGGLRRPDPVPVSDGLDTPERGASGSTQGVGGLRRPDPAPPGAGFGISAERQPNGIMRFSGTGDTAERPVSAAQRLADIEADTESIVRNGQRSRELRDQIAFNAGQGGAFRRPGMDEVARDLITGRSRSGRQAGVQLLQGQQQNAMQERQQTQAERMSVPERLRANIAARQAQRVEELQQELAGATDPRQRERLLSDLRALTGREDPMDFSLSQVQIGSDGMGNPVMGRIPFNQRTGQYVMPPGQGAAGDINTDSRAIAIRDNPSLTREQKVKALKELGYS